MDVPMTARTRAGGGRETLPMLKSRPFPQRVRAILETLLSQLAPYLEHHTVAALDDFEQALFRRAEQARNNDEQQRCFESLREVRRVRADIAPAIVGRFEASLAMLNQPRRQSSLARPQRGARNELSLVDSAELEETLVLVEAANRAEVRSSQEMFALGMRFATLAEAPMFEAEELPIGAHRLIDCIRQASTIIELPAEHRMLFFRSIDLCLFSHLERYFEDANRILVESRVLPDLVGLTPRTRRPKEDSQDARQASTQDAPRARGANDTESAEALLRKLQMGPAGARAPAAHMPEGMPAPADTGAIPATPDARAANAEPARPSSAELAESSARFQQRGQQTRFGVSAPAGATVASAPAGSMIIGPKWPFAS